MRARVYLETSIISYLAARPSRDLVVAGHQQLTHEWWITQRERFEVVISELVIRECGRGDPEAARARLEITDGLPSVRVEQSTVDLARAMVERGPLPRKAAVDALHISAAATSGIEYLLTWNCKHIANAEMRPRIERVCRASGYEPPILCTPEELMG